jgi:hypothetical protein
MPLLAIKSNCHWLARSGVAAGFDGPSARSCTNIRAFTGIREYWNEKRHRAAFAHFYNRATTALHNDLQQEVPKQPNP